VDAQFDSFCSDFYINQKLALTMDLPEGRESVLDLFGRVRKDLPMLDQLRRYETEYALESEEANGAYAWIAMRKTSLRSGWVNPERPEQAYRLHKLLLELAPYYLSVSPLDVDHLELVFGFDFEADHDRDEIIFDALLANSPLGELVDRNREGIIDAQPFVGMSIDEDSRMKAFVEIKTRPDRPNTLGSGDPISVYLTVRAKGPLQSLDELSEVFGALAGHGERICESRLIPSILVPIRQAILARPC
jgi:hypothetical protein